MCPSISGHHKVTTIMNQLQYTSIHGNIQITIGLSHLQILDLWRQKNQTDFASRPGYFLNAKSLQITTFVDFFDNFPCLHTHKPCGFDKTWLPLWGKHICPPPPCSKSYNVLWQKGKMKRVRKFEKSTWKIKTESKDYHKIIKNDSYAPKSLNLIWLVQKFFSGTVARLQSASGHH